MTKKDFITVSSVLKVQLLVAYGDPDIHSRRGGVQMTDSIIRALARSFASVNPRFDFDKFYAACGIEDVLPTKEHKCICSGCGNEHSTS